MGRSGYFHPGLTAGHGMPEWPASIAYGLLMCALWAWRRDLLMHRRSRHHQHRPGHLRLEERNWRSTGEVGEG